MKDSRGEWTERWSKVLAHQGGYEQFRYGTDTPAGTQPSKGDGLLQRNIIGSLWSGVILLDVDREQEFLTTRTAQHIGRADAISKRGWGFHDLIDARKVPPEHWPRQGPIAGADIKSCGFIPMPGCEHYSGELYQPVWQPGPMIATPELIAAINADRAEQTGRNHERYAGGGDGGGHDGEVAAEVLRMVLRGLDQEACYQLWLRIAIPHDAAWPFEQEDFERHYGGAVRKAHKIRKQNAQLMDAWRAHTDKITGGAR